MKVSTNHTTRIYTVSGEIVREEGIFFFQFKPTLVHLNKSILILDNSNLIFSLYYDLLIHKHALIYIQRKKERKVLYNNDNNIKEFEKKKGNYN